MKEKLNFAKVYFGFMSSVFFIAVCISLGIFLTTIANYFIISDVEYLVSSNRSYEIRECSMRQDIFFEPIAGQKLNKKTELSKIEKKKIQECENKAKKRILQNRKFEFKKTCIGTGIRFFVFIMMFIVHYSQFKKRTIENK